MRPYPVGLFISIAYKKMGDLKTTGLKSKKDSNNADGCSFNRIFKVKVKQNLKRPGQIYLFSFIYRL
jgi:hypothetical protein